MGLNIISLREYERLKPFGSDKVSVKNLQTIANEGYDAWGRQKSQPVHISTTLHLKQPFSSAASQDSVDASTVHYGHLAKFILSIFGEEFKAWSEPGTTALKIVGAAKIVSNAALQELTVAFSKATLLGDGVQLKYYASYVPTASLCAVLELVNLRVPALVGVNLNERTMKQMVVVSVWFDRTAPVLMKKHFEAEQIVSKTIEESAFQTLESLAEELATRLIKYFIIANPDTKPDHLSAAGVGIRIEKPVAVPQADAPAVEVYRSAEREDDFGKRMSSELGNKRPVIPFPLEGRLDEFLRSWKQD